MADTGELDADLAAGFGGSRTHPLRTRLALDHLTLDAGVSCPGRRSPQTKRRVRPGVALARMLSRDHPPSESGKPTARLLDDVRELVTQQLLAGERLRLIHPGAEVDVRAPGKRIGANTGGKYGRGIVGMDPHLGEVAPELFPERRVEGAARRPIVECALHGTGPRVGRPRDQAPP